MAARSQWFLNELEDVVGIVDHLYTLIAFIGAACVMPTLIFVYTILNSTRRICINRLVRNNPEVEIIKNTSVRSALDTRWNQGIITILLHVKGHCDANLIKSALYENVVGKKNPDGSLVFPHLRTSLISMNTFFCWTRSAWLPTYFDINNHVLLGSALFRGRPVSELNIQEYVSEVVSKYLPSDLPPWQIVIIPTLAAQEERYFILVRVHHLLLSEDHLTMGDLLLLENGTHTLWRRRLGEDDENPVEEGPCTTPLKDLFETPVAIPKLFHHVRDILVGGWTQFVLAHDPVENLTVAKSPPYLYNCFTVLIIIFVSSIKHLYISQNGILPWKFIGIVSSEASKRFFTLEYLFEGICNTFNPKHIITMIIKQMWWFLLLFLVQIPLITFVLIRDLFMKSYTICGTAYAFTREHTSLLWNVIKEILYVMKIIYTAPRIMLEDLFFASRGSKHQFQTVSLCGRKVVSWSEGIPLEHIRGIANATNSSTTAVLISATSGALREYFRQLGLHIPHCVLSTARYFPLENLITPSCKDVPQSYRTGKGFLCLKLPTKPFYGEENDPIESLKAVKNMLSEARERQPALYLASMWHIDGNLITKFLPKLFVKLLINHLSRKYAVTLTEVSPNLPDELTRKLKWGHEADGMMYWRPPQGNVSVALTILSYGDSVRLGVMTDALLSPQHSIISMGFVQQVNNLARVVGVHRERSSPIRAVESTHSSRVSTASPSAGD